MDHNVDKSCIRWKCSNNEMRKPLMSSVVSIFFSCFFSRIHSTHRLMIIIIITNMCECSDTMYCAKNHSQALCTHCLSSLLTQHHGKCCARLLCTFNYDCCCLCATRAMRTRWSTNINRTFSIHFYRTKTRWSHFYRFA